MYFSFESFEKYSCKLWKLVFILLYQICVYEACTLNFSKFVTRKNLNFNLNLSSNSKSQNFHAKCSYNLFKDGVRKQVIEKKIVEHLTIMLHLLIT